nr:hypothetical protein [Tanacetum cinerariifolium]
MDKWLKEVLMMYWLSIVETDKMIHTAEIDIVKLVVEIESFDISYDKFDEEIGSSDGLQPKQADLSYVHALNEFHLHEMRVVRTGSENHLPMLNKENYIPWSSRLLRYAKSRPNGKLIHNSIIKGPYVRQMIPEPGDPNLEVLVNETFHVQTDDELTEKELKQIEADDQAIQTILLGLPEDIYAAKKAKLFNEWEKFTSTDGESIESYYRCFLKLMNDLKRNKHFPEKTASNLKFLNNLQPEWSRHVTIVHQIKDLHTADYTQLYDFLKYNQKEVDDLKAERLAKIQDPLALMASSNNPYTFPVLRQYQSSFNQNYMQQPMLNLEDITDPTTAMNMALALMAKAFKLNYLTPTNNNQRISSNLRNRQIAQPGNLNGYNAVQNVRNQGVQNTIQNPRVQNVGNQNGWRVNSAITHWIKELGMTCEGAGKVGGKTWYKCYSRFESWGRGKGFGEMTPSLDNILSLINRFEDILGLTTNSDESNEVAADISNMEIAITASPTPTLRIYKNHPKNQIIGPMDTLIQTRNKSKENVWTLVDCPKGVRPIGIKWVLKNKKDERWIVIRNKARLVAQGHTQEEEIDYDEVFAPVARIEAIKLFLAYASFMGFRVYQMDVKSAFLYGTIDKEVYVMQPPRFQDPESLVKVYKVEKAMYGLHQAPRAWYGTLSKYLLKNGFQRALMHEKFQMSAMGELNFFIGLQVLQKEDGIFLLQDKYVGDILKKFGYSDVRSSNTPMDKENPWGKDGTRKDDPEFLAKVYKWKKLCMDYIRLQEPGDILKKFGYSDVRSSNTPMDKENPWRKDKTGKDVDLHLYRSMIRSLMYLTTSRPDIMFVVCACARHQVTPKECHLHTIMATSTTEAEYVAVASCCGQLLWIQNQLLDYGDCFEKKLVNVDHIHTDENVADLLTKPFDAGRFQYLV